jgi:hypothetical protein
VLSQFIVSCDKFKDAQLSISQINRMSLLSTNGFRKSRIWIAVIVEFNVQQDLATGTHRPQVRIARIKD